MKTITKKELSLHCRRRTRGVDLTTKLIKDLLNAFEGDKGTDTLGVPLLDKERMKEIWDTQKKHISYIQDAEGVQLYTQIDHLTKGNVQLPVYRCARGSTSLESFHLHLNCFIPGTSASDMHFQAYLLEGLVRWNEDRASAVVSETSHEPQSYSGLVRLAVNKLGSAVLGKMFNP